MSSDVQPFITSPLTLNHDYTEVYASVKDQATNRQIEATEIAGWLDRRNRIQNWFCLFNS